MAADTVRGNVVLFGGTLATPFSSSSLSGASTSETWLYRDGEWEFVTLAGPSPRYSAAMAFDPVRGTMVLHGGVYVRADGNPSTSNETWEFNGTSWSLVSTVGPGTRFDHSMAYDPERGRVLLFGGSADGSVWSWDGTAWTTIDLSGTGPTFRSNSVMVHDPESGEMLLIDRTNGQTFDFSGEEWLTVGSAPAGLLCASYDTLGGRMLATFWNGMPQARVGGVWAQVATGLPAQFVRHAQIAPIPDGAGGSEGMLLVGAPSDLQNQTPAYTLVDAAWTPVARKTAPTASQHVGMSFDNERGVATLYGGDTAYVSTPSAETWEFEIDRWVRRQVTGPAARAQNVLVYDPARRVHVLIGGQPSDGRTWEWDGETWTNRGSLGGPQTTQVVATYDPSRGGVVATVGGTPLGFYNGTTWTSTTTTAGFTTDGCATYDPVRGRVLAGLGNTGPIIQRLDANNAWINMTQQQQTSRWGSRFVYVPTREGVVCFGGFSSTPTYQTAYPRPTYLLPSTANAWSIVPLANTPTGRKYHGLVYDPIGDRVLVYGGLTHAQTYDMRETWALARGGAGIGRQPSDVSLDEGGVAVLNVYAKGGGVLRYQWRKNGEVLEDGGRISGARTAWLRIENVQVEDDAAYDVEVVNPCGSVVSEPALVTVNAPCDTDYNNDGGGDTGDVLDIANDIAAGTQSFPPSDPDFNQDGGADLSDILDLAGIIAGDPCP